MKKCILIIGFLSFIIGTSQKIDSASKRAARNFLRDGNDVFKKEKYAEAAVFYRKSLDKNPNYNKASRNLGAALFLSKNYKSAGPHYEKVLGNAKTKQEKAIAYHDLGTNVLAQGKFEKAIEHYKKALRNNPFAEDTRYNLAFAQKMLKKSGGGGGNENEKNKSEHKKKGGKKNQKSGKDHQKNNPKKQQKQQIKMTKQQMKQLLEAIKNQEEKTRKKIQKKKIKAPKKNQEKDW